MLSTKYTKTRGEKCSVFNLFAKYVYMVLKKVYHNYAPSVLKHYDVYMPNRETFIIRLLGF